MSFISLIHFSDEKEDNQDVMIWDDKGIEEKR